MTLKGSQPVILNGQRLYVVVNNDERPRYIPRFFWRWMVRKVVERQKVCLHPHENGKP